MPANALARAADALGEKQAAQQETLRRSRQSLFLRNVGAIIVAGVGMSWWLVEFTDFFPAVGGLLGLGGVFAWVAFLANLISEERKKELQHDFETHVLLRPTTWLLALTVLVMFAFLAGTQGTLVVVGAPDLRFTVEIRDGDRLLDTFQVAPGTTVKRSFFLRAGAFTIKPVGLPERSVQLRPFARERFSIPSSFTNQEALLAYLPSTLTTSATNAQVKVFILPRGRQEWEWYGFVPPSTYDGQSFWIGTSADIPEYLKVRWKDEAQDDLERRLNPRAVTGRRSLVPGDRVRVCVMNAEAPDTSTLASGEVEVISVRQQQFPQLLELREHADAPKGRCP